MIIGTWPGGKMPKEMSNIPCKVCGSPSSGYHFGAITCEGCKVNINKNMCLSKLFGHKNYKN